LLLLLLCFGFTATYFTPGSAKSG